MIRNRRLRIPLLLFVLTAAGFAWWLSRQPSSAVRDAASTQQPPMKAPETALEEHLQQARSFASQWIPRPGNTRYASADDYMWVDVKDCYRDRSNMMAYAASGYDMGASDTDAFIKMLLSEDAASEAQALQRWPDSVGVAWTAAMTCEDCPEALSRARHLAETDPDNMLAWLPLLEQAASRGDLALLRFGLEQAASARTVQTRDADIRQHLTPFLASLQSPASCALELERSGLEEDRPYTVESWRSDRLHAALYQHAPTRFTTWMDACLPGVLPELGPAVQRQCTTVLTRLAEQPGPFVHRRAILQHLLHLSLASPDNRQWRIRAREHDWAFNASLGTAHLVSGGQSRSTPLRELWDSRDVVQQLTRKGLWPPPAQYDPTGWWYGPSGRRLSEDFDRQGWPTVAERMRRQLQARWQRQGLPAG